MCLNILMCEGVLDSRPKGRGFKPHQCHCVVSLSKTHLSLLSTGSTQEVPSRRNWKIVDWDVKNQNKQTNVWYFNFIATIADKLPHGNLLKFAQVSYFVHFMPLYYRVVRSATLLLNTYALKGKILVLKAITWQTHGWKFSGLILNSGFWGRLSKESQPKNA